MHGFAATVLAAATTVALAAPAGAAKGDPCAAANRDVNLFSLLGNSMSGTYDKCLEELRDKAARVRLHARLLRGEAARLEAEAAKLEGERAAAARRLAAANARQADTLRRLEAAKESRSVDREKLQDVLAQGEKLARQLDELNRTSGVNTAQAERLKREQKELNRRIDAMLGEG